MRNFKDYLKYKQKDKNGTFSRGPRWYYKYWSRIKMKLKKSHTKFCMCYWCLKERYRTHTECPQCKKRELKSSGYHRNYGHYHESGTIVYCKCGYNKDLFKEYNRESKKMWDEMFK